MLCIRFFTKEVHRPYHIFILIFMQMCNKRERVLLLKNGHNVFLMCALKLAYEKQKRKKRPTKKKQKFSKRKKSQWERYSLSCVFQSSDKKSAHDHPTKYGHNYNAMNEKWWNELRNEWPQKPTFLFQLDWTCIYNEKSHTRVATIILLFLLVCWNVDTIFMHTYHQKKMNEWMNNFLNSAQRKKREKKMRF